MIKDHDSVALVVDLPKFDLRAGDLGVVGQVVAAVDAPHPPAPSPTPAGRGGANPGPAGDEEALRDELTQRLVAAYASGGIEGVRALLVAGGASEEQIAGMIAGIEAALGGANDGGAG